MFGCRKKYGCDILQKVDGLDHETSYGKNFSGSNADEAELKCIEYIEQHVCDSTSQNYDPDETNYDDYAQCVE